METKIVALRVLLGGVLSSIALVAYGCECVSPPGTRVAMGDQTNIVVWDAATHTEHFVRLASFKANVPDFGFIAPTPSKPDLAQADQQAFTLLSSLQPLDRHFGCANSMRAASADVAAVDVVQQVDVAGYRATTLLASDAKALGTWMTANGYATTAATEAWTKFYIAKGWYLTAFKVIDKAQVAQTGTIRMSFQTDQPFNPYFVPKDNIADGKKGVLHLVFVSSGDYGATIGKSTPWQDPTWTAPLPAATSAKLASLLKLPQSAIPTNAQIENFVDNDFPHAGTDDLYFKPQSTLPRTLVGTGIFVGFAAILIRRFRRRTMVSGN